MRRLACELGGTRLSKRPRLPFLLLWSSIDVMNNRVDVGVVVADESRRALWTSFLERRGANKGSTAYSEVTYTI
jgi:hypothetical protein